MLKQQLWPKSLLAYHLVLRASVAWSEAVGPVQRLVLQLVGWSSLCRAVGCSLQYSLLERPPTLGLDKFFVAGVRLVLDNICNQSAFQNPPQDQISSRIQSTSTAWSALLGKYSGVGNKRKEVLTQQPDMFFEKPLEDLFLMEVLS